MDRMEGMLGCRNSASMLLRVVFTLIRFYQVNKSVKFHSGRMVRVFYLSLWSGQRVHQLGNARQCRIIVCLGDNLPGVRYASTSWTFRLSCCGNILRQSEDANEVLMRLMFLLVTVGMMAPVACEDTTSPEPAAVSDSANAAELDATVEARVQATIAAQPTTTISPTLTVISKPTATATSSDNYDPENAYAAFDRMIADYDKALELFPSNGDIRIAAANAYYSRGIARMHNRRHVEDYDAAIADYDKAMELNPSNDDFKKTAAETYYQRGKFRRYFIGDHGGFDFYKATRLNPEHADAYHELGLHYFSREDYGNAIANFSKIIKLRPTDSFVTDAVAYFKRGSVYFALEDYGKSIADLSKAIELAPTHADAYYRRGAAYFFSEDYGRAIADIGEAIRLEPYFGYNLYNFDYNAMPPPQFTGEYFYGSKYDDAIWTYEDEISLRPNDADTYFRRGYVYFLMHKYARGMTDLNKAIELNPNHATPIISGELPVLPRKAMTRTSWNLASCG